MKLKNNFSNKFFIVGLVSLFILILGPSGIALALDHSGAITADETWAAGDNPHEIIGTVTVNNLVTVTLEPGVEVLFNGNYGINVYGALLAEGQEINKIRFTRGTGVGTWYGLHLYAGSGGIFDHCIIEWSGNWGIYGDKCNFSVSNCTIRNNNIGIYAIDNLPFLADNIIENNVTGLSINSYYAPSVQSVENDILLAIGQNNVIKDNDTGLYFNDCIRPTVAETALIYDNTTYGVHFNNCSRPTLLADISDSGTGVYYQSCTDIQSLEGIALTGNTGIYGAIMAKTSGTVHIGSGNTIAGNTYPLSIDAAATVNETSLIPTTGNQVDGIQVIGGTSQQDSTWHAFGLPYILTGSPTIGASGSLTVSPGVTVRLSDPTYLNVYGDLQAIGTSGSGITFTRNEAGRWNYIQFFSTSTGVVSYATVEFADSGVYANNGDPEIANCTLQNNTNGFNGYNSTMSAIHDCLITSNDVGIWARNGSDPVISQNCIKQNYNYGVRNDDSGVLIDAENNFWGDAGGPRHASNPNGRGDFVSDYIDFDPFLGACPL